MTCQSGKLNVVAPPQTQLFASSSLTYPDVSPGADSGSALVDVEGGAEVPVFARDVVGNVARVTGVCDAPNKKK